MLIQNTGKHQKSMEQQYQRGKKSALELKGNPATW